MNSLCHNWSSSCVILPSPQIGRQWIGELTAPVECTFPVNGGRNVTSLNNSPVERVSFCNFTTGGDGVLSWRKGLASLSNWLGGPETDASNSTDGKILNFSFVLVIFQWEADWFKWILPPE